MEQTLFKLLKPQQGEWNAFLEGSVLTANLLVRLLTYRYERVRTVEVKKEIVHYDSGSNAFTENLRKNPTPSSNAILYELQVAVIQDGEHFVTTLSVKRHNLPPILFTVSAQDDREGVFYVVNNLYTTQENDNGFYVFEFLDRLFMDADIGHILFSNEDPYRLLGTKEIARRMVSELTHFTRIRETLLRIYKRINALLIELQEPKIPEKVARQHRTLIEYYKQVFYQWVECALQPEECDYPVLVANERRLPEICFFRVPIIYREDDAMSKKEKNTDEQFKELLALLQYLTRVVDRIDGFEKEHAQIDGFTLEQIRIHTARLRYLILSRVDSLSMPKITAQLSLPWQYGFTQAEYDALAKETILSQNIIRSYITHAFSTLPITLFIGPQEERDVREATANTPLIFWLLESHTPITNEPYTMLMVFHFLKKANAWQRALYLPTYDTKESAEMIRLVDRVSAAISNPMRRLLIPFAIKNRCELSPRDRMYDMTPWYTLIVISIICERLVDTEQFDECFDFDWVGEVKTIVNTITLYTVANTIEELPGLLRDDLLERSLVQKCKPSDIIDVDLVGEGGVKPPIVLVTESPRPYSMVSDLAKLAMESQFIDDNPISDMLEQMTLIPGCYVFDLIRWGDMIEKKSISTQPISKAFLDKSVKFLVMPLNQKNIHWSLALIEPNTPSVGYYSSIKEDPYFDNELIPNMRAFLATQTPGIDYTFARLPGPTQAADCVDCALFMLNKISKMCTQEERVYSRDSIQKTLIEQLTAVAKQREWRRFATDYYTYYTNSIKKLRFFTKKEQSKYIGEYIRNYISILRQILKNTKLFSDTHINDALGALEKVKLRENVESIFQNLFNTAAVESLPKRKRENVLIERPVKTRKCVVYDKATQKLIDDLLTTLVTLGRLPHSNRENFIKGLEEYISVKLLSALVSNLAKRRELTAHFLAILLSHNRENEQADDLKAQLLIAVEEYVACTENEKKVMKCIYCARLTSTVHSRCNAC